MKNTTVVVMSEFGRRVTKNSVLGTDHGQGGVMFVMGQDGSEEHTIANWPGLANEHLVGQGGLTRNDELSRCAPPCPNATRTRRRHGQGFSRPQA